MKSMRVPTRAPPPVPQQQHNKSFLGRQKNGEKKKPPPRPPPPNFSKMRSKSAWNLNQPYEEVSLIDLSPPRSPATFISNRNHAFSGSISSSFSNSTSSLASSKKSYELDNNICDTWSLQSNSASQSPIYSQQTEKTINKSTVQMPMPTIIRAQPSKVSTSNNFRKVFPGSESPPMPNIPPPSPPKETVDVNTPYAIALYNYPAPYEGDLELEVNDIIVLLKKVNDEWYYGRVGDKEGMFPANFVDVQVPIETNDNNATALYEFIPQLPGDLPLYPGKVVTVIGRISKDWLIGESEGQRGQFPVNFIDKVPSNI
ncbi:SH3 domain-containing protein 19 [Agrilus planipennis]|uniref:SH3 domain-containing protein 19 n=1 Tax=Agrilus planipennis TaxID=224129 RepID=A0A1W4XAS1_AGRPL|nr:SH3 domain-containing protein 19 [Agrilus planipennis]XP_018333134.1 SH3 domain-containing protein 19 [Agrilus planipennis]